MNAGKNQSRTKIELSGRSKDAEIVLQSNAMNIKRSEENVMHSHNRSY